MTPGTTSTSPARPTVICFRESLVFWCEKSERRKSRAEQRGGSFFSFFFFPLRAGDFSVSLTLPFSSFASTSPMSVPWPGASRACPGRGPRLERARASGAAFARETKKASCRFVFVGGVGVGVSGFCNALSERSSCCRRQRRATGGSVWTPRRNGFKSLRKNEALREK